MTTLRDTNDYLDYLKAIFPPGRAFLRLAGLVTTKILSATADAMALFHEDVKGAFLENMDPCSAGLNKDAWLETTGVSGDPCLSNVDNCLEAKAVLQLGSADYEGQEEGFYTFLLTNRGIDQADITYIYESEGAPFLFQYQQFRTGLTRCGHILTKDVARFYMEIVISNSATYPGYDAGTAEIPWVACLIDRFKPAHVVIEYTFT